MWGVDDPWIKREAALKILEAVKGNGGECRLVEVKAGHCPQDDEPVEANRHMREFAQSLFK